jgi:hypothetical protein
MYFFSPILACLTLHFLHIGHGRIMVAQFLPCGPACSPLVLKMHYSSVARGSALRLDYARQRAANCRTGGGGGGYRPILEFQ